MQNLIVKPEDFSTPEKLIDVVGVNGALLSMIEIGLGSLFHAFHVPFGGFFMSLNQGFILSRVIKLYRGESCAKKLPMPISNIAALLKSLSPAGNRLGPMIAIAMQGFLFNSGIFVLGANIFGCLLGMTLLCLWSYLQVALYFYLMFGKKLVDVLNFHFQEIQALFPFEAKDVGLAVGLLVLIKIFFGVLLVILAFALSERHFQKYQSRILKSYHPKKPLAAQQGFRPALAASARDLLSPLFLMTFAFTAAFFVLSGTPWQETSFYLIRPLAVGFILFFSIRILPTNKIVPYLEKTRFRLLSRSVARAVELIRR